MTDRVLKTQGLKSIRKQCEQITIEKDSRILIVSSPVSEATISSAILCKALLRSGGIFHITFVEPTIDVTTLNILQKTYSTPTTLIIGVDVIGKKNIRKEKGYPVFIGGSHQSKQCEIQNLDDKTNTPVIAYVLADEKFTTGLEELQLAAVGIILRRNSTKTLDRITKAVLKLAQQEALIQERKGFKLFGASSQPLMEALVYSIFPYLSNISGTPEICEKILDDADIPFSKRRIPIDILSIEETQRLTKQLIPRLNQSSIPQVLGQDFVLTHEREDSPIRFVSSIRALALYSWSQWNIGAMFSVWMGDRSRMLREIVDSYSIHCKEVIAGFNDLESKIRQGSIESESTESISVYRVPGTATRILSDFGRISFDENLVDKNRLLMLISDSSAGIIWDSYEITLNRIMVDLKSVGLDPISSSPTSIIINNASKETQEILLKRLQAITSG